jgi:HEPN domain-containing protein
VLDPALLAEVKGWLKRAASDLRAAELAREAAPPLLDTAVFHCQQTAEKALNRGTP